MAGVRHVLRLDDDLSDFYAKAAHDPDLAWAATGAGRMLQGPTVFEDVVKTVCTTNCTWSATRAHGGRDRRSISATRRSAAAGRSPNAFPTPERMADTPRGVLSRRGPRRLPRRVSASLARSVADGELDLEALASATPDELPDAELEQTLLALPGRGAVRGRAHHDDDRPELPIDPRFVDPAEVRAAWCGKKTVSDAQIRRRFARYGDHAGLAFWLFVTRDWVDLSKGCPGLPRRRILAMGPSGPPPRTDPRQRP